MKKIAFIISIISLISASLVNELNIYQLKNDLIPLREGETVITADDASYISPALNYLKSGELKDNSVGEGAYFLRPPGYSMLFIALGHFNFKTTLEILKATQLFLFALSIFFLFFIAYYYLESTILSIIVTGFYGISNIASGFVYYTLTEGVTPFLVTVYIFLLLYAQRKKMGINKDIYYLLAATAFSFLFITRPFLGILGLAFPFCLGVLP